MELDYLDSVPLREDLRSLRKHHLGWTVVLLDCNDEEYSRFVLETEPSEYETNSVYSNVTVQQIETEDDYEDLAEIFLFTNIEGTE